MIIKIAVQNPERKRYCYINEMPFVSDCDYSMVELINARAREFHDDAYNSPEECKLLSTTITEKGYLISIKSLPFTVERVAAFFECYGRVLESCMRLAPDEYLGTFPDTFVKMKIAILEGTYHKDSETFKAVCKELKIKNTYKAINAYLRGE